MAENSVREYNTLLHNRPY